MKLTNQMMRQFHRNYKSEVDYMHVCMQATKINKQKWKEETQTQKKIKQGVHTVK